MFEGLPCIDWEEELPDEYPALPKREDYANEKRHEFKLQYWENNKEEWQLRKLRELYVKTMERIWPDWVAYFKKIENWARHDLYMAVISCDNTWCLNRLNAWLDESEKLERWEEYQPLVQF